MINRAIYPVVVGLLLGTLQTGLYFQMTFTLSSGFGTYLLVTLCWLTGSMIGVFMVARLRVATGALLVLSVSAYGLCSLLVLAQPFNTALFPVYGILIALVGIYPGVFFARSASLYQAGVLFFRENNGFIAGLVIGTLLFMLLGRVVLWIPPLILAGYLIFMGTPVPNSTTFPQIEEA